MEQTPEQRRLNSALKRFKRGLEDTGKIDAYKDGLAFMSNTEKRRRAEKAAHRRNRPRPERWYVRAMDGTVYHNGEIIEVGQKRRRLPKKKFTETKKRLDKRVFMLYIVGSSSNDVSQTNKVLK